jgi:hypothetical protein
MYYFFPFFSLLLQPIPPLTAGEPTMLLPSDASDEDERVVVQQDNLRALPSHFQRTDLSPWWRYGMPVYILSTLTLLLASDIGSGIRAILVTFLAPKDRWSTVTTTVIFDESIFTSVGQLWNTQSYALAIFIAVCSIAWPYIKLLLSLYTWITPIRNPARREKLLEILDFLGKWSFADVFVFCKILVAFR